MFKMPEFRLYDKKNNSNKLITDNNSAKNNVAEKHIVPSYNKLGKPIDRIINEDLPEMIEKYIEENGLSSHPKLGLIKMWGGSYAEAAIRNDDHNTEAKNIDVIQKDIVYRALDDYCEREKIRISEAA